ncbi:MAG: molybdopterin biosynthesis protein [Proteobacteria bacterium]|nr:MAG: molybdopterin biosynthesis protein [Pseudomonadota bacterium]
MKTQSVYLKNQPLEDARKTWQKALEKIHFLNARKSEIITVDQSRDRITAQPVVAAHSSPTYNAAAMDGIAIRFFDLNSASEANPVVLEKQDFLRVNTGNNIPEPYNAVVMIEDVHFLDDGRVELIAPATPWQHIRTIGEDIVATEMILPEAHTIRPIDQGAMLAAGITEVEVIIAPKITVIPTGSELIEPGHPVEPGQIIEFNSRILAGYLNQWGGNASAHAPVKDDPELLAAVIQEAVKAADFVVTNAGASAGTKDFSASILATLGTVVVHGVAIKPGKPVILAIIDNTPVIGLPGYPVSALLTLQLFGKELIHHFLGTTPPAAPATTAYMSRPIHSPMGVEQFIRVTLGQVGDKLIATPSGKGAGAVMSMVRADGLLTIPARSEGIGAGEPVRVELLRKRTEVDTTLVSIGSHDNILDLLANQLYKGKPSIRLSSAHVGSLGGIMAIRRGEAHIAGCHLLDEKSGEYNISFIKRFLPELELELINLCYREQGFIVKKSNPLAIFRFEDICTHNRTFINRQKGAGTRLLTDKLIRDSHLSPDAIKGYDHEEYTHMNVAAAVAGGRADCGLGIRAAAEALDLDFVPITEERYDLVIPRTCRNDQRIVSLLEIIRKKSQFHDKIKKLGGYDLRDCGSVIYSQ